jgi:hypothetical protein
MHLLFILIIQKKYTYLTCRERYPLQMVYDQVFCI